GATTALVGRSVGRGDAMGAAHWARRLTHAGVYTALAFGLLMGLSALAIPVLFANAGREVQVLAVVGILINAVVQVVKVRNMILGARVMPAAATSAGDHRRRHQCLRVRAALAIALALFTPLGIIGLFVARVVEQLVKLGIFTWRTRRISWESVVERQALSVAWGTMRG
ncbi:MAG: MATE family efflux transporter, partial [Gemmatimonadetes bacterium]|nr:MATE family efflux transporter [Gemmatimonadota bacterium]